MSDETNRQINCEIVWLALEGAGGIFRAVLREYRDRLGRDSVSADEMRAIIDTAWERSGKQARRARRMQRRAMWDTPTER